MKNKLTRATSLSVLGVVSSPGNLIIGEGAEYVAWKAMNCNKNTLRTIRRQLIIVGEPIFSCFTGSQPWWTSLCSALRCKSFHPVSLGCLCSSCTGFSFFLFFFFFSSLTGHPAPRLYELSQFCLHMHFFQPFLLSAQSPGWEIGAGEPTVINPRNNSLLTHSFGVFYFGCFFLRKTSMTERGRTGN